MRTRSTRARCPTLFPSDPFSIARSFIGLCRRRTDSNHDSFDRWKSDGFSAGWKSQLLRNANSWRLQRTLGYGVESLSDAECGRHVHLLYLLHRQRRLHDGANGRWQQPCDLSFFWDLWYRRYTWDAVDRIEGHFHGDVGNDDGLPNQCGRTEFARLVQFGLWRIACVRIGWNDFVTDPYGSHLRWKRILRTSDPAHRGRDL
jgi:hypothetical protein